MGKIDDKGYLLTPEEEIITDIKTIIGDSFIGINTETESPMGQVSLELSSRLDTWQKDSQNVFNSFDLDNCIGQDLDNIGKIIGGTRRILVPSIITVKLTSTALNYIITEGSTFYISSDDSLLFTSISDYEITSLEQEILMQSQEYIASDVISVGDKLTSVKNYSDLEDVEILNIEQGVEQESNFDYRTRLKNIRASNSSNGLESMDKALQEIDGVQDSIVLDINRDDSILLGYVEPIVLGGSDNDIAQAIWDNIDGGTLSTGGVTENIIDIKGGTIPIKFSRPTDLNTTFTLTIEIISNKNITQDQRVSIVSSFEELCSSTFIGGVLYYQDFYASIVNIISGSSKIVNLTINGGASDIEAGNREKITPYDVDPNTSITIIT